MLSYARLAHSEGLAKVFVLLENHKGIDCWWLCGLASAMWEGCHVALLSPPGFARWAQQGMLIARLSVSDIQAGCFKERSCPA